MQGSDRPSHTRDCEAAGRRMRGDSRERRRLVSENRLLVSLPHCFVVLLFRVKAQPPFSSKRKDLMAGFSVTDNLNELLWDSPPGICPEMRGCGVPQCDYLYMCVVRALLRYGCTVCAQEAQARRPRSTRFVLQFPPKV